MKSLAPLNLGNPNECTILELAERVRSDERKVEDHHEAAAD